MPTPLLSLSPPQTRTHNLCKPSYLFLISLLARSLHLWARLRAHFIFLLLRTSDSRPRLSRPLSRVSSLVRSSPRCSAGLPACALVCRSLLRRGEGTSSSSHVPVSHALRSFVVDARFLAAAVVVIYPRLVVFLFPRTQSFQGAFPPLGKSSGTSFPPGSSLFAPSGGGGWGKGRVGSFSLSWPAAAVLFRRTACVASRPVRSLLGWLILAARTRRTDEQPKQRRPLRPASAAAGKSAPSFSAALSRR